MLDSEPLHNPLNSENINTITVYTAPPQGPLHTGHISIEIVHAGDTEYISLYSQEMEEGSRFQFFLQSTPLLIAKAEDEQHLRQATAYRLDQLNAKLMLAKAQNFRQLINNHAPPVSQTDVDNYDLGVTTTPSTPKKKTPSLGFGILGKTNKTCASIVFDLLEIGGMQRMLPYYVHPRNARHWLLLSLRPPLAIAAAAPIAYSFLMKHHDNNAKHLLIGLGTAILQMLAVFIPEMMFAPHTRKLIELCHADKIIQFVSTTSFGLGGILAAYSLADWTNRLNFTVKFFLDLNLWVSFSFGAFLLAAWVTSAFAYLLFGLRTVVTPKGLTHLMEYLTATESIPPAIRHYYFKMESLQHLMVVVALLLTFFCWLEITDPLLGFMTGAFSGTFFGYLLTIALQKITYTRLSDSNKALLTQLEHHPLLETHEIRPGRLALLFLCTSVAMNTSLAISTDYTDNIYVNSAVSTAAAMLGYLFGVKLVEAEDKLKNLATASFNSVVRFLNPQRHQPQATQSSHMSHNVAQL